MKTSNKKKKNEQDNKQTHKQNRIDTNQMDANQNGGTT
jgi:hypothetical protein